jgi:hypothetical protein
VADAGVAADTIKFFVLDHTVPRDFPDKVAMTIKTICIKDFGTGRPDPDRLMEILQREGLGMKVAVGNLGPPFAEKIVRHVAVVADGKAMMAGFLPAIELVAHDMAIGAGARVVRKITVSLRVIKGVATRTRQHPNEGGKQ